MSFNKIINSKLKVIGITLWLFLTLYLIYANREKEAIVRFARPLFYYTCNTNSSFSVDNTTISEACVLGELCAAAPFTPVGIQWWKGKCPSSYENKHSSSQSGANYCGLNPPGQQINQQNPCPQAP